MIHDIPKPNISDNFTIDDIHKIREWNYERLRDATVNERLADTKHRANIAKSRMEKRRQTTKISV